MTWLNESFINHSSGKNYFQNRNIVNLAKRLLTVSLKCSAWEACDENRCCISHLCVKCDDCKGLILSVLLGLFSITSIGKLSSLTVFLQYQ